MGPGLGHRASIVNRGSWVIGCHLSRASGDICKVQGLAIYCVRQNHILIEGGGRSECDSGELIHCKFAGPIAQNGFFGACHALKMNFGYAPLEALRLSG